MTTRHIAIVGSGPAGYYTAEAALKALGEEARVDIFDMLPVPFGLIRSGVAPDHQSIKAVSRRYEKVALSDKVRFVGNVAIGRDVSIEELRGLYDAVVLATGAPHDRALGVPGEDLANVFGSAAFVGWYNGHPQFARLGPDLSGRTAAVIGMGNVALDVARILAKTPAEFSGSDIVAHALAALRASNIERILVLGRRGPHQIQMTPKELGELGRARARGAAGARARSARCARGRRARSGAAQVGHPPARFRRFARGGAGEQAGHDRVRLPGHIEGAARIGPRRGDRARAHAAGRRGAAWARARPSASPSTWW